jgi:hypothetical protein
MGVTIRGRLPDLDDATIELPCPKCRLRTPATFGEIRLDAFVICRGCKAILRLRDRLGGLHRFKRDFDALFARWRR